jgi:hypothetical protein
MPNTHTRNRILAIFPMTATFPGKALHGAGFLGRIHTRVGAASRRENLS